MTNNSNNNINANERNTKNELLNIISKLKKTQILDMINNFNKVNIQNDISNKEEQVKLKVQKKNIKVPQNLNKLKFNNRKEDNKQYKNV